MSSRSPTSDAFNPHFPYHALPDSVTFGPGEEYATVDSVAIDDELAEGDEDIVAVIADPPPVTPPDQPAYRHVNTTNRATATIRDNDGAASLPVVTIAAEGNPPTTGEPCPVCLVAPVEVTLSRSSPLDEVLRVGLAAGGTAVPSVDYPPLPETIEIPAGQPSFSFLLGALDDLVAEGPTRHSFAPKWNYSLAPICAI
ncbi:MAG TPA: Calx-beta domain-containing protein [Verrucomicrobiales bacterium]|nr:Calx-beta domain-containing protein [Verrucomicrobiales bacterium]